jgi:hypothetical protein
MGRRVVDPDRLRAMHADGRADAEIAAALGVWDVTVLAWRRKLGLPPNYRPGQGTPAGRARANAALALARPAGGRSYWRRAKAAWAALAESYGLPADLSPREVGILVRLAGGPMTLAAIRAELGGGQLASLSPPNPRRYLPYLARRGLVARVRRTAGAGCGVRGGRRPDLYFLTAAAADLLAKGGAA